jgi:hypothetical protein
LLSIARCSILTAIAQFLILGSPVPIVLPLLVVLFILAIFLMVVLWFGSLFAQTYLYTAPVSGVAWRAPLAAAILASFYFGWSFLNIWGGTRTPLGGTDIPLGVLWEFSPRVEVIPQPVPEFVSKRRTSEPARYILDRSLPPETKYRKVDSEEFWSAAGTEYIEFERAGQAYKFVRDLERDDGRIVFVDENSGLEMQEFEVGRAGYTSMELLMEYFVLNLLHLVLWIGCLWVLLGFQFSHAAGLGFLMWVIGTVLVLPILFEPAAAAIA